MKTILLPFYHGESASHVFSLAAILAGMDGGYLECLFVIPPPPIIDGETIGMADSYLDQIKQEGQRLSVEAHEHFRSCAAACNLAIGDIHTTGAAVGFHQMEGPEGQIIGDYGRLFDLIVIGRELGHPWIDWHLMAEAALFESACPIVIAPKNQLQSITRHTLIAWNGSPETARTIKLSIPVLRHSEQITVLELEGWGVPGPSAEQVAAHLHRHRLPVKVQHIRHQGNTPGPAILDAAATIGADLLIKGAYTQSRLRQFVFGGATRHILHHAEIPVLMAH